MSPGRNVLLDFTKTMGVPVCTKFYKIHWNLDDTEPYLQLNVLKTILMMVLSLQNCLANFCILN